MIFVFRETLHGILPHSSNILGNVMGNVSGTDDDDDENPDRISYVEDLKM